MRTRRVLAVAAVSMALVAAACGSDDDEGGGGTVDAGVKSAVEGGLGASTTAADGSATTLAPATSMEEFESRWEAKRDEIVKRITDNGWGLQPDGKTITGPEGFKVDLTTCTAPFNNTEGLTDTSIKLGATTAFSGVAADGGNVTKGMDAVFKHVNAEFGGIRDSTGKTRTINLVARDDALDPTRTIPLIDEMLDNEKVFAVNSQGSGGTMRTYDKVNQRCVPQPYVVTGHPAWGDPVVHPWTTGQLFGYSTEAVLWGSYIEQQLPQGAKVAAIVQNNDFGKAYENGLRNYIAQSQHGIELTVERIEPTAPTVTNEMTTLAAGDPDAFIVMATGVPCTQAAIDAQNLGLNESAEQLWMPSVCRPLSQVGRDRAGDSTEGWLVAGGGIIDINDTTKQDLVGVKWARELLQDERARPRRLVEPGQRGELRLDLRRDAAHGGGAARRAHPGQLHHRHAGHRPDRPAAVPARRQVAARRQQGRLPAGGLRDRPVQRGEAELGADRRRDPPQRQDPQLHLGPGRRPLHVSVPDLDPAPGAPAGAAARAV